MKRIGPFLLFALILSFTNVHGIHAQGFFKQLLEAAGSILEDSGKDIVLEGTLTNKGSSDMNMQALYSDDKSSIYDSEGNAYKAYMMVGANELSAFSDTKLPADIPVKCKVVVKNVPASIHEFSIVKKYFEIGESYYLQFRNFKF